MMEHGETLPTTTEMAIARLVLANGLTVAVAESCTGGLVAYRLTAVPGSSAWFRGAIVAYTPEVKVRVVGVPSEVIEVKGVVSAETAVELARGARRVLQADIGLGVTGYAGPNGGTADIPVGTVYLGLAAASVEQALRFFCHRDRAGVRAAAARAATQLLLAHLEGRASLRS